MGEVKPHPRHPRLKHGPEHCLFRAGRRAERYGQAKAQVAFSIPDLIQGMCFSGDAIYLTSSWGLGKSFVYKYDLNKISQSGTKQVCGETVPLYNLTMQNMEACYTLPPMAEEIEYVDGRFYITNESASDKYVFGKYTGGRWCRNYAFN